MKPTSSSRFVSDELMGARKALRVWTPYGRSVGVAKRLGGHAPERTVQLKGCVAV
jgi:hypothetical protein